ncbi:MAG: ABC transporter ATP-binding protein [Rhodospirillales bacterium]
MAGMIALKGLTKKFGNLVAVDGISLSVNSGEVLGFLGPNGAGKSTTMKMVTGFLPPTSGTAEVCGFDVGEEPMQIKRRIGYLPEGAPTYGDMTPARFLGFISEIRGFSGKEGKRKIAAAVEKLELSAVMKQPIETLSKGFKRRVGLAQAILHDPDVLIMDEPTDGLDPNQKHQVRGLIKDMSQDKAIVISTHILEEVQAVCTRAIIIAQGRIKADGTPDELLQSASTHNAVVVRVEAGEAETLRSSITGLGGIEKVDIVDVVKGEARLRVYPKGGKPIAGEISDLINSRNIPVREIFVEKGSLDEVFRKITTSGEAGE